MDKKDVQSLALHVMPSVDKLSQHYYDLLKQYSDRRDDKDYLKELAAAKQAVVFVSESPVFEGLWYEREKLRVNQRARVKRLRQTIEKLLTSGPCWFVTLTFSDDVLSSTSEKSRRRYVSRFLKARGLYVGNIDFGKENGREHYHAVVQADNIDLSDWDKYGFSNAKKVRLSAKASLRLAKYVAKLTNHAIKESAGNTRIIYGYHVGSSDVGLLPAEKFSVADVDELPF